MKKQSQQKIEKALDLENFNKLSENFEKTSKKPAKFEAQKKIMSFTKKKNSCSGKPLQKYLTLLLSSLTYAAKA